MKILLAITLIIPLVVTNDAAAQHLPLACMLKGISAPVLSMDFSPDDQSLVVGCADGTVELFDVALQQTQAMTESKGDMILQVSFRHDGESIAIATSKGKLILWDRNLSKRLFSLNESKIMCFAFDSTSDNLLIGRWNAELDIFDVRKRLKTKTIGKAVTTRSVAWSPNGKLIACGNWGDYIQVFDAKSYEKILQLERHRKNFPPVAFSPDSNMLAVGGTGDGKDRGSDCEVLLWNLMKGKEHARLRAKNGGEIGATGPINRVLYCPNGKLLAVSHIDQVCVWDLATEKVIANLGQINDEGAEELSFAFSHNSKYLAVSEGREIHLWSLP